MIVQKQTKRVVAVHDLSCMGRVSLMTAVPVLTSMGLQVCPLPTALLSAHTQYPDYTFLDLTEEMKRITGMWKKQGFTFDAFYSGYLGSEAQVDVVLDLLRDFCRETDLVVVDPVLGDNGRLYKGMPESMIQGMRLLVRKADVITPNVTEMYLLLDGKAHEEVLTDQRMKTYLARLSQEGPQIVIVTGVPVPGNPHLTSVYAFNARSGKYWKVTCPFLPAHYPGTGDTFTSVIVGALMQGDSLPLALDRATQFTLQGIRATFGGDYDNLQGIQLEKVLRNLDQPIQVSSFELI